MVDWQSERDLDSIRNSCDVCNYLMVVSSVLQHFSVLDPLLVGVVRPWFFPVCHEEVDSVCWSPILQGIFTHWHLTRSPYYESKLIIWLLMDKKNKGVYEYIPYHQLGCSIIRAGLRVGDHLRVGQWTFPGEESRPSSLWKLVCIPC